MKQAPARPRDAPAADPSAYWTEELENIDYLIEASPLIVRKLRHHAFHITGIRPYDYRVKGDGRREHFEARLQALRELGGDALLVPESPALGGFGYDIDGRLFNVDTLKFYEVLIGMERGGVLPRMRALERPVVCEIGAGWGGFAYQFKTLFPRDHLRHRRLSRSCSCSRRPISAPCFRDARMLFVRRRRDRRRPTAGATPTSSSCRTRWRALVSALPLDLTVNMVSFQEMTDAQVRGYAAMAARGRLPVALQPQSRAVAVQHASSSASARRSPTTTG